MRRRDARDATTAERGETRRDERADDVEKVRNSY
jgi:hypothetical protein